MSSKRTEEWTAWSREDALDLPLLAGMRGRADSGYYAKNLCLYRGGRLNLACTRPSGHTGAARGLHQHHSGRQRLPARVLTPSLYYERMLQ